MAYKPIYDLCVDVALPEADTLDFLIQAMSRKLMIVGLGRSPGGDFELTLRGTKPQLEEFMHNDYDTHTENRDNLWVDYTDQIEQVA